MFLPTTSTTTTTSTKTRVTKTTKITLLLQKASTSNTTLTSSTATYTTMSTTNQGSFTTIINNIHHNYSTTTISLPPLHHTPTTLQPMEFPGEALQLLFLPLWINPPYSFYFLITWRAEERSQDNVLGTDIFNWGYNRKVKKCMKNI